MLSATSVASRSGFLTSLIFTTRLTPALVREAISFLSDTNTFWIGLNHDLINSERTELCVLLEEQAHYEVGIIPNDYSSNSYSDILARQKNELKAKKWAVKKMISRDKLFEYIKNTDYIDVEELADYFEVIPQFMKEALIIYGII